MSFFGRLLLFLILLDICLTQSVVEESTAGLTCLMEGICEIKVGNETKSAPCQVAHEPHETIDGQGFDEFLQSKCPHLFDKSNVLKDNICCSSDQKNSMSLLYKMLPIEESCPSCAVNAQKYFCNLLCQSNQNDMVIIDKAEGDHSVKSVTQISYVVSNTFAQTFFESCYDVKVFGTYLMDMDYICGQHKREGCDALKFLETLGSIPEMPVVVRPVIVANATVIGGKTYYPMDSKAYHCYEPTEDRDKCECEHCPKTCAVQPPSLANAVRHSIANIILLVLFCTFIN